MSPTPPRRLECRETDAHKGTFGRVLLVGGSRGMSGSIAMSGIAALRSGCGLLTLAVPDRCLETVAAFHPCLMTLPFADTGEGRFGLEASLDLAKIPVRPNVIGCGPGMTVGPGSIRLVERLIHQSGVPRVFDADAINILAETRLLSEKGTNLGPVVLTPHPGELARLTGVDPRDRPAQIAAAHELSQATGVVVVVKGGPTVVVSPIGAATEEWTNETGNPGMATAGSGDVLTGIIASLLGQGLSPFEAAKLGVWVHGLAGDLAVEKFGQSGMTAVDLLDALPAAMLRVA